MKNDEETKESDPGSVIATSAGVIAGGVSTSGPAISVAGGAAGGGLSAYGLGLGTNRCHWL